MASPVSADSSVVNDGVPGVVFMFLSQWFPGCFDISSGMNSC